MPTMARREEVNGWLLLFVTVLVLYAVIMWLCGKAG